MTAGTELVPTANMAELDRLDGQQREVAVTQMLGEARQWLAHAVEATEPAKAAEFKAWIATIAETTKQLNLSKEIQQDALEMVRRAERGVGVAIRQGQERGDIRPPHGDTRVDLDRVGDNNLVSSPTDFAPRHELSNSWGGIYDLADEVTDEVFEGAITEAKVEGNLSRANVIRKIHGIKSTLTRPQRIERIRVLAPSGMTSGQIAKELQVTEDYVRRIAKENEIEIPADRVMHGSRRGIDHNHLVDQTVMTLEGLVVGLQLLDYTELDTSQIEYWASSLTDSLKALNKLNKTIKELAQ